MKFLNIFCLEKDDVDYLLSCKFILKLQYSHGDTHTTPNYARQNKALSEAIYPVSSIDVG